MEVGQTQSPISQQMDIIRKVLSCMEDNLANLQSHLCYSMREVEPRPTKAIDGKEARPNTSQLYIDMCMITERIQNASNTISDINGRLDL